MSFKYRRMTSKGDLMKKVYTQKELRSIDSATPIGTWKEFPSIDHCMNYNEPNRWGKLDNIAEVAQERGIKIVHAPKIYFTEFNNLKEIFRILEEHCEDYKNLGGDPYEIKDCIEHLKELIEFENLEKIEE